jgi:hypothetical protein
MIPDVIAFIATIIMMLACGRIILMDTNGSKPSDHDHL